MEGSLILAKEKREKEKTESNFQEKSKKLGNMVLNKERHIDREKGKGNEEPNFQEKAKAWKLEKVTSFDRNRSTRERLREGNLHSEPEVGR
jgi:hypothetical protein